MSNYTKIEWTDSTWNPWQGCRKISAGCKNCYMYRGKHRFGKDPKVVIKSKTTFSDPLKWKKSRNIFTCSWSDFFIEDADAWRQEAWNIIEQSPQHVFQILTKRPERIMENLPKNWGNGWDNVWLGVSIESQEYIYRKKELLAIPSRLHFLSLEPLLGEINLGNLNDIEWIICGGESGPNFRPLKFEWIRKIRDIAKENKIPFFFKQIGGNRKIDNAWGGRIIDGQLWDQIPIIS